MVEQDLFYTFENIHALDMVGVEEEVQDIQFNRRYYYEYS